MESDLVRKCIAAATEDVAAVDRWRKQRRTLERLPSHLAEPLFRRLLDRRLLTPSLLEVFKWSVEDVDLSGQSCVDAEWMAYLGGFRYLRRLVLTECPRINNSAIWSITGMETLKELDLSRCFKITNPGFKHLLSLSALEKLCISQIGITSDLIGSLASLSNLSMLDLGGIPVKDSALKSMQVLTKLQHLDLWGSEISNKGAISLKSFPNLSFLNLAWTSVTELPTLSSLKCLNMSNCIIYQIFEGTGVEPRLEKLILSGATINDVHKAFRYVETSSLMFLDLSNSSLQSFEFLQPMNVLTHLDLGSCSLVDHEMESVAQVGASLIYLNISYTKVTSYGVGLLAGHVPRLETILLAGTPIDDEAISYISMMPSLKVIDLHNTHIKGLMYQEDIDGDIVVPSFSVLQKLCHLERLNMEGVNLKEEALSPLSGFSKLSYLSLKSFSLTDTSLYRVSSLPSLIHLCFCDAVLTNGGLDSFVPPPTLEVLDLSGCWLLTKDALLPFCHAHPQIEVRHELAEISKQDFQYSSPPQVTISHSKTKNKMPISPLKSNELFLDQRLKYSREELLALQFSSAASTSTDQEP